MIEQGGQLDDGVIREHGCRESLCVRVDQAHLWPATTSENIRHDVHLGRHQGNIPGTDRATGGNAPDSSAHAYRLARQMLTHDKDQLALG